MIQVQPVRVDIHLILMCKFTFEIQFGSVREMLAVQGVICPIVL